MEFTGSDLRIIVGSTLFFIMVSFVFPAVGFTSPDVTQSGIPEYNESNEAFDYLADLERPELPQRPSEGTLRYVDNQDVYQDNRRVWLNGNSDNGVEITLTNDGTLASPNASLFLNHYSGGSFDYANSTNMLESDEFATLEDKEGYVITFSNVTFTNEGQANMTMTVEWEIAETPAGSSAVGSIPIVGTAYTAVYEAIQGVIAVMGLFFQMGWYFIQIITVGVLGTLTTLYNIVTFVIGIFVWIITRYSSIVSNAPTTWAALFLAIPGLVLSAEFMKGVLMLLQTVRGS